MFLMCTWLHKAISISKMVSFTFLQLSLVILLHMLQQVPVLHIDWYFTPSWLMAHDDSIPLNLCILQTLCYYLRNLASKNGVFRFLHGGLARAFANLRAVLRVNNSLSGRIATLPLGLVAHYRES